MRVISEMRTPRSRTTAALSANSASSSDRRPNSLSSIAPPTLKRSVISVAQVGVAVHLLAGQAGQPAADEPGRRRNSSGNSARQSSVTCQLSASIVMPTTTTAMLLATVLDRVRGERALGADHVVVEPGDQRAGLRAGEERERLALHVAEHLGAQVEDQSLADPRGQPAVERRTSTALNSATPAIASASSVTRPLSPARMPSSTIRWTSSGIDDDHRGVDHGEAEEDADQAAVRPGEADDPAHGPAVEPVVDDAAVGPQVSPGRAGPGPACSSAVPPVLLLAQPGAGPP